ncbi:hypothetical protein ILUMI_07114 [Ignelater luminosus]|uniref:Uncharacterized protein n=1 Tax=Ignelater luminosus TaxID=2038154 RepID=A0A8K0D8X7_IGNLU|nr:hypothetical protein ILUMI_07114 [Ignelater luminosus]
MHFHNDTPSVGDIQYLELESFEEQRKTDVPDNQHEFLQSLTQTEKVLIQNYTKINKIGKGSRTVSLLISNDRLKHYDMILGIRESRTSRLPPDVYQTAKVSKILRMTEKGNADHLKNKCLDEEIEINIYVELSERDADEENESEEERTRNSQKIKRKDEMVYACVNISGKIYGRNLQYVETAFPYFLVGLRCRLSLAKTMIATVARHNNDGVPDKEEEFQDNDKDVNVFGEAGNATKEAHNTIENKWKSLERAYKSAMENRKSTERGRRHCPYEKELQEILGFRHSINPGCTLESSTDCQSSSPSTDYVADAESSEHTSEVPSAGTPVFKKRKRDNGSLLSELQQL